MAQSPEHWQRTTAHLLRIALALWLKRPKGPHKASLPDTSHP